MNITDIHSHLLPGLDDGPRALDESLRMCALYVAHGVTTVVATPHMADYRFGVTCEAVRRGVGELSDACRRRGIDLEILPGADVRLQPELLEMLDAGELLTLADGGRRWSQNPVRDEGEREVREQGGRCETPGGVAYCHVEDVLRRQRGDRASQPAAVDRAPGTVSKYLLLELPLQAVPLIDDLVDDLRARGVTPVLSHPERNPALWRRPDRLAELVERGCLAQITGASLLGHFGSVPRRTARRFLESGIAHVVASDAHGAAGRRRPEFKRVTEALITMLGEAAASRLLETNPANIIRGEPLGIPLPTPTLETRNA